jgi:hypothetical protein
MKWHDPLIVSVLAFAAAWALAVMVMVLLGLVRLLGAW